MYESRCVHSNIKPSLEGKGDRASGGGVLPLGSVHMLHKIRFSFATYYESPCHSETLPPASCGHLPFQGRLMGGMGYGATPAH